MLVHAARIGNMSAFECLVFHGAIIADSCESDNSQDASVIAAMLQRRQEWIDQAASLTHHWHVPLSAMRVIHEYVVGFNWSAVCQEAFSVST